MFKNKILITVLSVILLPILIIGGLIGGAYAISPSNIAFPTTDHLHFRMQLIIDGKAENFSEDKYQISYEKGICGAQLTNEPIHFHDFRDQVVHIHWNNITGGQVLKNYGLNLIGGDDNLLGYRLDKLKKFTPSVDRVGIFRKVIPDTAKNKTLWVYTGDKNEKGEVEYRKRDLDAFLWASLENFFGKESIIKQQRREAEEASKTSNILYEVISGVKVNAHGTDEEHAKEGESKTSQADNSSSNGQQAKPGKFELERINNLLGNVVIFAQNEEPTKGQIEERFRNLVKLEDSSCGG